MAPIIGGCRLGRKYLNALVDGSENEKEKRQS